MCPLQDRNRLCVAKLRRSLDVGQGDVSSSGQEQVVCG